MSHPAQKKTTADNIMRAADMALAMVAETIIFLFTPFIFLYAFWVTRRPEKQAKTTIVVGLTEIANNIATTADAFRQAGHEVITVARDNVLYADNYYDVVLPKSYVCLCVSKALTFMRLVNRADRFIYFWHISYLPFGIDYLLLRLLGKAALIQHCGDDVRYRPLQYHIDHHLQGHSMWGEADIASPFAFFRALWAQRLPEILGIPMMTVRDQATFQSQPAYHFIVPQKALIDGPRAPSKVPVIIHAPSDKRVKRTDIVLEAIELLKAESANFEFELIYEKPNHYVLERLQQADIVVDQPGGWIGRFAMEAMAYSCVVVGGNRADYYGFAMKSPVLQFETNAETLAQTLRELLSDHARLEKEMTAAYRFWHSYYSYDAYVRYIEDIFNGTAAPSLQPVANIKSLLMQHARPYQRWAIKLLVW